MTTIRQQIEAVPCLKCQAPAGRPCTGLRVGQYHGQRLDVVPPRPHGEAGLDRYPHVEIAAPVSVGCPKCGAKSGELCEGFEAHDERRDLVRVPAGLLSAAEGEALRRSASAGVDALTLRGLLAKLAARYEAEAASLGTTPATALQGSYSASARVEVLKRVAREIRSVSSGETAEPLIPEGGCMCVTWAREGSYLLTGHHSHCFNYEIELRSLVFGLYKALRDHVSDLPDVAVPPASAKALKAARRALFGYDGADLTEARAIREEGTPRPEPTGDEEVERLVGQLGEALDQARDDLVLKGRAGVRVGVDEGGRPSFVNLYEPTSFKPGAAWAPPASPSFGVFDFSRLEVKIAQTIAEAEPDERDFDLTDVDGVKIPELSNYAVERYAGLAYGAVETLIEEALGETILTAAPDFRVGVVKLEGGQLARLVFAEVGVDVGSPGGDSTVVMIAGEAGRPLGRTILKPGEPPRVEIDSAEIGRVLVGRINERGEVAPLRGQDDETAAGDVAAELTKPLHTFDVGLSVKAGSVARTQRYRVEVVDVPYDQAPDFAERAATARALEGEGVTEVSRYSVEPAAGYRLDDGVELIDATQARRLVDALS